MNDVPNSELLSAYLDGELTAEERAGVEQWLATDPAARKLLDELRAVSGAVQGVARFGLGENFGRQVLEAAQQQLRVPAEPVAQRRSPRLGVWWAVVRRHIHTRALAWSAVAAVVALMFAIKDWQSTPKPAVRPLAMAPKASVAKPHERSAEKKLDSDKKLAYRGPDMIAAPVEDKPGAAGKLKSDQPRREQIAIMPAAPAAIPAAKPAALADKSQPLVNRGLQQTLARSAQENAQKPGSAPRVLVIDCYVSAEAAQAGELDKLLARQNIAPWTAANGSQNYISYNSDNMQNRQLFGNSSNNSPLLGQQPGAQFNAGRGTQNGIAAKDGEIPQATNSDALTDLRKGAENQAAAQGQNNAKYNNEAAARVIQVQATRLQIHAAVAEMKSRPMPFLAVNIRPSADFPLDEPTADRHAGVLARKRAATVTHPSSPSKAAGGLAGDATSPAAAAASVPAPKSPADATSAGLKGSMSKSEQSSAGEAGKKQAEDGYGLKGATSVPGAAKGGGVAEKAAAAPEPTYLVLFVVHVASPAQATPSPTR